MKLAKLKDANPSQLATLYASCCPDGQDCENCRPFYALLHEQCHMKLLYSLETSPLMRRHTVQSFGLAVSPIAERIWQWFCEHKGEWLTALAASGKRRPTFGVWLGKMRKELLPEFIIVEAVERAKKLDPAPMRGRIVGGQRVNPEEACDRETPEPRESIRAAGERILEFASTRNEKVQMALRFIQKGCTLKEAAELVKMPATSLTGALDSLAGQFTKGRERDDNNGPVERLVKHRRAGSRSRRKPAA